MNWNCCSLHNFSNASCQTSSRTIIGLSWWPEILPHKGHHCYHLYSQSHNQAFQWWVSFRSQCGSVLIQPHNLQSGLLMNWGKRSCLLLIAAFKPLHYWDKEGTPLRLETVAPMNDCVDAAWWQENVNTGLFTCTSGLITLRCASESANQVTGDVISIWGLPLPVYRSRAKSVEWQIYSTVYAIIGHQLVVIDKSDALGFYAPLRARCRVASFSAVIERILNIACLWHDIKST